jgi:glutamyl-tRNA synthetase
VEEYVQKGYLPEALLNFLAMLGWNPGTTEEIFSLHDLITKFSLDHVHKAGAVFDLEKLDWLQGQWMRRIPLADFTERIRPALAAAYPQAEKDPELQKKAALIQERITFFHEAPAMLGYFYEEPAPTLELLPHEKQKVTKDILPQSLQIATEVLQGIPSKEWTHETLIAAFQATSKEKGLKLGQLLWPLRVALTGQPFSPGATEVACAIKELLGEDMVFKRIQRAMEVVK